MTSYTNSCSVTISRVEGGEEGNFTWHRIVNEKVLSSTLEVFFGLPQTIATAHDVLSVVECVDSLALCVGNRDTKFFPLIDARKGSFQNQLGEYFGTCIHMYISWILCCSHTFYTWRM